MHWPPPPVRMKRTPRSPPPLSPCRYHRDGGGENATGCATQLNVSAGPSWIFGVPPQPAAMTSASAGNSLCLMGPPVCVVVGSGYRRRRRSNRAHWCAGGERRVGCEHG